MNDNYLQHYGVKGMKWGIRRDARLLANNRRNIKVKKIKDKYDVGEISSERKKIDIKKANVDKKIYLKNTKETLKSMSNKNEVSDYKYNIAKQAISEVPNRRLKSGAHAVNKILAGINIGSEAIATGTAISMVPGAAPLYLGSLALSGAVIAGRTYLIDKGIDKLT